MNLADLVAIRVSSGPFGPQFAQMLRDGTFSLIEHFGAPSGISATARMTVDGQNGNPVEVRCPHWVLVRRVPSLAATGPLSDEERGAFTRRWPPLRELEGDPFDAGELLEGDLLLTVWPAAFRQIEQIWTSLEIPIPEVQGRPQMPVPRFFWVRGLDAAEVEAAIQTELTRQFGAGNEPRLSEFLNGQVDVLMPVDGLLGKGPGPVYLRAFDQTGLPIDPNYVFGCYAQLTAAWGFLAQPDAATAGTWSGPSRQVFVFSDHTGAPYAPWPDELPEWVVPQQPPEAPARQVSFSGLAAPKTIPDHGVLVVPLADGLSTTGLTQMVMDGSHVRHGLHPHGQLAAQTTLSLTPCSFQRVRVVDLARWFPRSPNPQSTFQRYSEGNEVLALVDGGNALREVFRAFRATHETATYEGPDHLPAGTPHGDGASCQVLAIDAWYASHTTMLGLRAMLGTPRTQPGGFQEEEDEAGGPTAPADAQFPLQAAELLGRLSLVPEAAFPGVEVPAPEAGTQRYWWLARNNALPPGGWLAVTQLDATDTVVGTDPRDMEAVGATDIYGVLTPRQVSRAFVGAQGQAALSLLYDPDWRPGTEPLHRLQVTAVIWEPEEDDPDPAGLDTVGKGRQRQRDYGTQEVGFPGPDPLVPPAFSDPAVSLVPGVHLELGSEVGHVQVVLPTGMLTAPRTVAVLNPRSSELWWKVVDPLPPGEVAVPVENVGYQDTLLVAFLPTQGTFPPETGPGAGPDLSQASHLFPLRFGTAERLTGAVAAHPYEALGMARQAIAADVDVRLLAWRDDRGAVPAQLDRSMGGVVGYNATLDTPAGGRRGQALLDGLHRATAAQHQKPTFVRTPDEVLALVGGVDQVDGRYDHPTHPEINPARLDHLWHDAHCRIRGRAALDVYRNFRDRWNAALSHPEQASHDDGWGPGHSLDPALTPLDAVAQTGMEGLAYTGGHHVVQINRTIAPGVDAYSGFLDTTKGDQSIRAAYERALGQARRYLYIEDQYFFHTEYARRLNERLQAADGLEFVVVVMPERLSEAPYLDLALYAIRRRALSTLLYGTPELPAPGTDPTTLPGYVADKVALFHIRNDVQRPIYVHAKVLIADDLWTSIGSSNFIFRSMNFDSEIAAAVIDPRLRLGGHRTARDLRLELMAEHLRLDPRQRPLIEDPTAAFRLIQDVLEGRRELPGTGIYPVDLRFTTFGYQPAAMDGDFYDAVRIIMDPDGDELRFPTRVLTLFPFIRRLQSEPPDPGFSGFGYLNADVVFPQGFDPASLNLRFELWKDEPDAEHVTMGPFPGDQIAKLGLLETGSSRYFLRAEAVMPDPTAAVVASGEVGPFDTPGFANQQTVTLTPV